MDVALRTDYEKKKREKSANMYLYWGPCVTEHGGAMQMQPAGF